MEDSDSISKNYFVVIREGEEVFPLSIAMLRCLVATERQAKERKPETAGEKTNLARDIFRVQLTENKGSSKNLWFLRWM